jgi:soluble lytic murein transglycosylase
LLAAACLTRADQPEAAYTLLDNVARDVPAFAGYCAWRQGGRAALDAAAGNSFLGAFGPEVLTTAGEAEKDPQRATRYWLEAAGGASQSAAAERAVFLLATKGATQRAKYALRYLKNYPGGRYGSDLAKTLSPATFTERERLELAALIMDRGDYGPALRMLRGSSSGLALYRQGRCHAKLGDTKRAQALLGEAVRRDPNLKLRVHLTRAEMALTRRAWDEAIAHARQVSRERGSLGLSGLKLMVLGYLRADREVEATFVDREIITRYPESDAATDGRWRGFWKAFREGRTETARVWAQGLSGQSGLLAAAGGVWSGRIDEDAGRKSAAIASFNEVARKWPYSYYGWRSRYHAAALSGRGTDPGFRVQDGPVTPPVYDLRGLLPDPERSFLGVAKDGALPEADSWPADARVLAYLGLLPPDRLPAGRTRIVVAHSVGSHFQGITWAGDDPYLSHPLGYWPALEGAARANRLDPLFLAALVKQESYFDPRSRSWVGAMGLAQLMPFTAEWVGRQIPARRKPLSDPAYNLQLGAWYLAYTGRLFEGQPILATAAYNAGVGAAKRWRAGHGTDLEGFIERIPYRETRHYVKKVYGYYWTYRWLYRDRGLSADFGSEVAHGEPEL